MVAIQTDGLTKRFGSGEAGVLALNDLDLTVEEGEVFGFLGPNGAGKSTTINILLNFIDPTAGSAEVLGHDVQTESKQVRQRTGVLPEGAEAFERLTPREHIAWVEDAKGIDADTDAILDTVGIADAADRKAGGFSKGMQQRLGLGMALAGDPDLLILDEPSSGLDPTGMKEMRQLIREQAASGTTVFFSSHILSEVEAVCDRVAILNRGRLVAIDSIDGLRDALGTGSTMTLTVDAVPDSLTLAEIAGVSDVVVDGRIIRVSVDDAPAKVDVIDRIRDDGASILDVTIEESSLEDLFSAYTGDVPPRVNGTEVER